MCLINKKKDRLQQIAFINQPHIDNVLNLNGTCHLPQLPGMGMHYTITQNSAKNTNIKLNRPSYK